MRVYYKDIEKREISNRMNEIWREGAQPQCFNFSGSRTRFIPIRNMKFCMCRYAYLTLRLYVFPIIGHFTLGFQILLLNTTELPSIHCFSMRVPRKYIKNDLLILFIDNKNSLNIISETIVIPVLSLYYNSIQHTVYDICKTICSTNDDWASIHMFQVIVYNLRLIIAQNWLIGHPSTRLLTFSPVLVSQRILII